MISNKKARLVIKTRVEFGDDAFSEIVIWELPQPARGSLHHYKYRVAHVDAGVCIIRYDNEAGKGDHKHIGDEEYPYRFSGLEDLFRDFDADVAVWRKSR